MSWQLEPPSPIYPSVNLCANLSTSPRASLNSQESILYSPLYCVVFVELCCAALYCIILYCIAYSARKSKSPAVSKNRKIRAKLDS